MGRRMKIEVYFCLRERDEEDMKLVAYSRRVKRPTGMVGRGNVAEKFSVEWMKDQLPKPLRT